MKAAVAFVVVHSGKEHHDELLREWVAPVARRLAACPELDSLFFARYNKPAWQLRFRVLGAREWVEGPVRETMVRHLEPLADRGIFSGWEFARYDREYERYGGAEGMRLAERIFLHDSLACLELILAEARGALRKSRREYSLVMTERFLDLMEFEPARRMEFHEFGYRWTTEVGGWDPEDFRILEERYGQVREGLGCLVDPAAEPDAEALWGGAEAARIAGACLEATRPVVKELLAAHRAGRIAQDLVKLAWSYCHMHCNRLGVDSPAEAILRYFMHRLYQEREGGAAGGQEP